MVAGQLPLDRRQTIAAHASLCAICRDVIARAMPATAPGTGAPRIARYEIDRALGAGASGLVYAARDRELGRPVALKLLRPGARADRLRREAQLLARLDHPNVVAVYDVGEHDGQLFIAMALVDGDDLRRWARQPRTVDDVVRVICAAGLGVAAAHARGLVHRDLKPDNIFVARDGRVLVGDFGLARLAVELDPPEAPDRGSGPSALTATGSVLGTPRYMAPEQAAGAPCPASDQFSLCVTAWELVFGAVPFAGDDPAELAAAILRGPVRPVGDRRVPGRIERALRRGLAPDPAARFPDVAGLVAALAHRPRRWRWLAATALAAAAAVGAVMLAHQPDARGAGCAGQVDLLELAWPAQRAALLAALPAGPAVPPLLAELDRQVRDLRAARLALCAARASVAAPAHACHDRLRDRRAAFAALATQTTTQPIELWAAALRLPTVESCQHEPVLAPAGPLAVLARRVVLHGELGRAEALTALDRAPSPPALHDLAARARELDDGDAALAAALLEARAWLRLSNLPEAERTARSVIALAERRGADRVRASANALAAQAVAGLGRAREAEGLLDTADTALTRVGPDRVTARDLATARVEALFAIGDIPAALAAQRRLIEMLRDDSGPSPLAARAYDLLATVLENRSEMERAAEASEHAGDFYERFDPGGVDGLKARGLAARYRGDLIRSAELHDQIVDRQLARRAPAAQVLPALLAAGDAYFWAGQWPPAMRRYDRARAVFEALALEDRDARLGMELWISSGQVRWALREFSAAVAPLRLARATAASLHDTNGLAIANVVLADVLERTGRASEAAELLEPFAWQAVDLATPLRARGEFAQARALWTIGRPRDRDHAVALAEDAARDYAAGIARLASQPIATAVRGLAERGLAELRSWRAAHVVGR